MRHELSTDRTSNLRVFPPPCNELLDGGIALRLPAADHAEVLTHYGTNGALLEDGWVGFPPDQTKIASWAKQCVAERLAGWTREGSLPGPAFIVDAHQPFVGILHLIPRQEGVIELAYGTLPTARGRGIASRALRIPADWILSTGRYSRLELRIEKNHRISQRVAENAGFRFFEDIQTTVAGTGEIYIDSLYVSEKIDNLSKSGRASRRQAEARSPSRERQSGL